MEFMSLVPGNNTVVSSSKTLASRFFNIHSWLDSPAEMKTSTQVAMFLLFFSMRLVFLPQTSATVFGTNETDRLALLAIKSKISHDPQGVLSSWNDSLHFCQWEGVSCGGRRSARVATLNLPTRGLVGSMSPYIGNLSFLTKIELSNNSFSGGIPPEVGRLLRLQNLSLYNNSFEGNLPANLSGCTNLTSLSLGRNKLVGKIPNSLSSMLMLKVLSIHTNNLQGGIPPFIGNLTSLESLSLGECHLGGRIPDVFHKLTNLRQLGLAGNNLIGTIPLSIYNLSLLEILSLTVNQLIGNIPVNLPSMQPHLQILELGMNNFSGILPHSMSNFSELQILDVGSNDFYGKVTFNFGNFQNLKIFSLSQNNLGSGEHDEMKFLDSLSNCSNLGILTISNNKFNGMLPDSLGNFSANLNILLLYQNFLYGSLPSSIGHLSGLTSIEWDHNQLSGTIPPTIGNLQNLRRLYLGDNTFSGKIPDSLGNLSLLFFLAIDNNKLEGTIPSSLGNCHSLNFLSLNKNNLSGSIPKQIFQLSSLSRALDLGRNHLSGPLPVEVSNLKNLEQLYLGENSMSGELPGSLGSCTILEQLDLSGNFFQGSIPLSFSSLRTLQGLDLSRNNFSGLIPKYLAEFPLQYLNISFNNFQGEVPVVGVFANSSAISVAGNYHLCGGISELHLSKCSIKHSKGRPKFSTTIKVVISIVSMLSGAALVTLFLLYRHKKKGHNKSVGLELKESFTKISYESLLKGTDGFSPENLIGVGGFASVYKGKLGDNDDIVAVKVLNLQHRGGLKSFVTECEALRHVRHRNLVKVITCCSSVDFQGNDFKAIVYEFMPNGSLEEWLHSPPTASNEIHRLNLVQRIQIVIDVAFAVDYLHHQCEILIIHCDLKPSNILLDEDMVAHVGDFGLVKFLLPEPSNAEASSRIRGTIGYAPPEYGVGNEVSAEGDIYSYGILVLEMVTGKKPTDPLFQEGLNLHNYASMAIADHRALDIVEPMLLNQNNRECLISMLNIGVACSMESPEDRMDISRVIHDLHFLLKSINTSH